MIVAWAVVGPSQRHRRRRVVVGLDLVCAGPGPAHRVFLGAVATGQVTRKAAADRGELVRVRALLAGGLGDPQVHVGHVGVPRQDDAQVHVQRAAQAGIECHAFPQRQALALRDGEHAVRLHQRQHLNAFEAAVPLAEDHVVEQLQGSRIVLGDAPAVVRPGAAARVRARRQGQGEVARRVRLLRTQLGHAGKQRHRQVVLPRLLEPACDDAQQARLVELQLQDAGQDADAHVRRSRPMEEVGAVQEEGRTTAEGLALREVDGVGAVRRRVLQRREVRRVGIPLLHRDDWRLRGLPLGDDGARGGGGHVRLRRLGRDRDRFRE